MSRIILPDKGPYQISGRALAVDRVFPQVVEGRASLVSRFESLAASRGFPKEELEEVFQSIPIRLLNVGCFLDTMTKIWRYEFGRPIRLDGEKLLWGANMWPPVASLFDGLLAAFKHVPEGKRRAYLQRLADPDGHLIALAEMLPVLRITSHCTTDFEVPGLGPGNHTVDWHIGRSGRPDLAIDVKFRVLDLIDQANRVIDGAREAPEPTHDPARLLRGLEPKFSAADPTKQLQGGWIVTNLQQDEAGLRNAFTRLDPGKVHIVIIGDWDVGVTLLVQPGLDVGDVCKFLGVVESRRFLF